MLFHVSDDANITRFEPRPSEYTNDPVVWAIDDDHLRNYLVPRDCPRVTYYAGPQTSDADRERLLGLSSAVVAIEERWLERLEQSRLYCYSLPDATFECLDEGAGYWVSREAIVPAGVEVVRDPILELRRRGVELRVLPNLWPLRDIVAASSLQFSIIRIRNALPRATNVTSLVFREYFREALESGGALVAVDRKSGRIIGSSRYFRYGPDQAELEIGWTFLARAYWGGAYNAEMKRLMLGHAFQAVERVIFLVGETNVRSRRAVEKVGGVLTDRVVARVIHGAMVDHVVYEIRRRATAVEPLRSAREIGYGQP